MRADDLEILKLSPTLRGAFEEGKEQGRREGSRELIDEAFTQQAGREPTPDEQQALAKRAQEMGSWPLFRAIRKLRGAALAAWLLHRQPEPR